MGAHMTSESWTPPDDADPNAILSSAQSDAIGGRYERALRKFLWFHKNAVRYQSGLAGVRLSFALSYWLNLSNGYGPAHEAFVRTRDETEEAFRREPSSFDLFMDLAAMNKGLGENQRTADIFEAVAQEDFAAAKPLYHVAERSLIAEGRYRVCAPYLEPAERVQHAAHCYELMKTWENSRPLSPIPIPKNADLHYIRDVGTLVALLVLNGRTVDAMKAYFAALQVVRGENCRQVLGRAMAGHFPGDGE
jgi:hypothetical protein